MEPVDRTRVVVRYGVFMAIASLIVSTILSLPVSIHYSGYSIMSVLKLLLFHVFDWSTLVLAVVVFVCVAPMFLLHQVTYSVYRLVFLYRAAELRRYLRPQHTAFAIGHTISSILCVVAFVRFSHIFAVVETEDVVPIYVITTNVSTTDNGNSSNDNNSYMSWQYGIAMSYGLWLGMLYSLRYFYLERQQLCFPALHQRLLPRLRPHISMAVKRALRDSVYALISFWVITQLIATFFGFDHVVLWEIGVFLNAFMGGLLTNVMWCISNATFSALMTERVTFPLSATPSIPAVALRGSSSKLSHSLVLNKTNSSTVSSDNVSLCAALHYPYGSLMKHAAFIDLLHIASSQPERRRWLFEANVQALCNGKDVAAAGVPSFEPLSVVISACVNILDALTADLHVVSPTHTAIKSAVNFTRAHSALLRPKSALSTHISSPSGLSRRVVHASTPLTTPFSSRAPITPSMTPMKKQNDLFQSPTAAATAALSPIVSSNEIGSITPFYPPTTSPLSVAHQASGGPFSIVVMFLFLAAAMLFGIVLHHFGRPWLAEDGHHVTTLAGMDVFTVLCIVMLLVLIGTITTAAQQGFIALASTEMNGRWIQERFRWQQQQEVNEGRPSNEGSHQRRQSRLLRFLRMGFIFSEVPRYHVRAILGSARLPILAAEALAHLTAASFSEDCYGTLQRHLSDILSSLLSCLTAFERYVDSEDLAHQRRTIWTQDQLLNPSARAIEDVLRSSIYVIVITFRDHLASVPLSPEHTKLLQRFENYVE